MTELKDIGELDLIKGLAKRFSCKGPDVLKGIGDDCAVLKSGSETLLLTTDILVEGIHFISNNLNPVSLARKLLAVNLSDIASMGGRAKAGLLTMALPPHTKIEFWESFSNALFEEFRRRDIDLLGGDTSSSPGPIVLNLILLGRAAPERILYRSGAVDGDLVFVSRPLGDAAAGLVLQKQPDLEIDDAVREYLGMALETPRAEEELGPLLAESRLVTSMIDVSDGLSTDLGHLAEASNLGAEIFGENLPFSKEARLLAERLAISPAQWALFGGEDYALLFTVQPSNVEKLLGLIRKRLHREIWPIARMKAEPGLTYLAEGKSRSLSSRGYEHFRFEGS